MKCNRSSFLDRSGSLFKVTLLAGLAFVLSNFVLAANPAVSPRYVSSDMQRAENPSVMSTNLNSANHVHLPIILGGNEPSSMTQIDIDGLADDWQGRLLFHADPVGDADTEFLDLAEGYAFVNKHALYILVKTAAPTNSSIFIDMVINADGKDLQITWAQGQTTLQVVDWTSGSPTPLRITANTTLFFDEAFEARIDLDDLESSGNIGAIQIAAFVETGGSFSWSDDWSPNIAPPIVNEEDPPKVHSEEDRYVLARRYGLPGDLVADLVMPSAFRGFAIGVSETGIVYIWDIHVHNSIVVLDKDSGALTKILDLPDGVFISRVTGGPGDTAFVQVDVEVWQVSPDGSYTIWGNMTDAFPVHYARDGRLLGITHDRTSVVELHQDGSYDVIASGFQELFDLVGRSDGVIAALDIGPSDIIRVNPDGSKQVLVPNQSAGEPSTLDLDTDEALYGNLTGHSLTKIDMDTGALTHYPDSEVLCHWLQNEFAFVEPDKVFYVGGQISWADLASGDNGILVSNSFGSPAIALGPDGNTYFGTRGCGTDLPGQVIQLQPDGSSEVYLDGLSGTIQDLTFAPNGNLFLATGEPNNANQLFYVPGESDQPVEIPGAPEQIISLAVDPLSGNLLVSTGAASPILAYDMDGLVESYPMTYPGILVHEIHLAFGPDNTLYAYIQAGDWPVDGRMDRWMLQLDLTDGTSTIVNSVHREVPGGGIGNLAIDNQGVIWVLVCPDSELYRITPQGEKTLFAQDLPIDTPGISVNQAGDIYFTHASGNYQIYHDHE